MESSVTIKFMNLMISKMFKAACLVLDILMRPLKSSAIYLYFFFLKKEEPFIRPLTYYPATHTFKCISLDIELLRSRDYPLLYL